MKRNDIHRPSVLIPADYQFVAYSYIKLGSFGGDILGDCAFLQEQREIIRDHMKATGTYFDHEQGGNCHICGAHCIYTALFYHSLTNTYIRCGLDCTEKLDFAANENVFKTAVKYALELKTGKRKAEAILAKLELSACWTIYIATFGNTTETPNPVPYFDLKNEERIIVDIVGKLIQYGGISEKQENFLGSLLSKITRRAEIEAARQAQYEAAAELPVPTGRTIIEGIVLALKGEDGPYGFTTKMLVQHVSGWKVWGTAPSKIDIQKGDKVRFHAAVEASKNDLKFGYFSRPTKTEVLNRVEVALA